MQAEQSILDTIQRRQLKWHGHKLRMEDSQEWKMAKEDLPVDTARLEEKRKTATFMEEPSDGLNEKLKHDIWEWIDRSWLYRSYRYVKLD